MLYFADGGPLKHSMNEQKWIGWIRNLPNWVKGFMALVTGIITFVLLFRANLALGIVIVVFLALAGLAGLCVYMLYAKTPPLILGGRGVHRFARYRPWAAGGLALVCVLFAAALILRPGREYIRSAFSGPATPTSTVALAAISLPTQIPAALPTGTTPPSPTPLPFQPARNGEILVVIVPFDGTEDIHPEAWIALKLADELASIPDLADVRVERYGEPIPEARSQAMLDWIRTTYNPSIIVWGWYDKIGITAKYETASYVKYFLPDYKPTLADALRLPTNPDEFVFYIGRDLPQQVSHLTFLTIAQLYIAKGNYPQAEVYIGKAIANLPANLKGTDQEEQLLAVQADVRMVGSNDYAYAIQYATDAIARDPMDLGAYSVRYHACLLSALTVYMRENNINYTLTVESLNGGTGVMIASDKLIPPQAFKSAQALQDLTYIIEHVAPGNPDLPIIYYLRGIQNYAFGNIPAAIEDMQRAESLNMPDSQEYSIADLINQWERELATPGTP